MALVTTDKLSAFDQTFRQDRYMAQMSGLQEGVVGANDFKVSAGGASLQWSVAAGSAWVQGDDTTRQGLYHQVNDAAITGLVSAGHATLPRIDQVILQIADSSVFGVSDTPTLSTLAGTATAGATLDNRTGASALPNSALRLADILVPAALTGTISAANIRDRRTWVSGAQNAVIGGGGGNYTTTSAGFVNASAGFDQRIECSNAPLEVAISGMFLIGTAAQTAIVGVLMDGVEVLRCDTQTTTRVPFAASRTFQPGAGSKLFTLVIAATGGATTTVYNTGSMLPRMTLREFPRQLANNGTA